MPIYFYNRNPQEKMNDDWYLLQSGFFVALTQFANELEDEQLKYIIMERHIYAFDEVSNLLLILGDTEKISESLLNNLQGTLGTTSQFLNELLVRYNLTGVQKSSQQLEAFNHDFTNFLKVQGLIESDSPIDPAERSKLQKFIFKTIGYEPGKCNIGPAERLKRLIRGIFGFLIAVVAALFIFFIPLPYWTTAFLAIPLFLGFNGLFMYFFRFCPGNAMKNKYNLN